MTFLTGRKHDRIRPHSGDTAQSPRAFHAATRRGGSHVRKSAPERRATKREALAQDSPRTTLPSEKPSEHILAPDALLGRASNVSDGRRKSDPPLRLRQDSINYVDVSCGMSVWRSMLPSPYNVSCKTVYNRFNTLSRMRIFNLKNKNDAASWPCSWCGACRLWLGWL